MRSPLLSLVPILALAACAGSGPASLGYGVPAEPEVTYAYGDTTLVTAAVMGQRMEIGLRGSADYGVAFGPAPDGVEVTLTVERLAATVSMPMASPEPADESDVQGALVFSLDRRGNATVTAAPEVSQAAGRMISGLTTAHTFFPGLPDRVVAPGDQWVDTLSYEGDAELGATSESSVIEYTVVGDTVVEGRDLLKISLSGTTESSNSMDLAGTPVAQESTLDVEGHVLWDTEAGVMFELVRNGRGRGEVQVPIVPLPLPIELESVQRARLRSR